MVEAMPGKAAPHPQVSMAGHTQIVWKVLVRESSKESFHALLILI